LPTVDIGCSSSAVLDRRYVFAHVLLERCHTAYAQFKPIANFRNEIT
jgi:hypothetical protein